MSTNSSPSRSIKSNSREVPLSALSTCIMDLDTNSSENDFYPRRDAPEMSHTPILPWLSDISDAVSDAESITENQAERLLESPCPMDAMEDVKNDGAPSTEEECPLLELDSENDQITSLHEYKGHGTEMESYVEDLQISNVRRPKDCKSPSCGVICTAESQVTLFYVVNNKNKLIPMPSDEQRLPPQRALLPFNDQSALSSCKIFSEGNCNPSQSGDINRFIWVLKSTEDNTSSLISTKFSSFYNNKEHLDFQIYCKDDYVVQCHRIVLAAWSSIIEKMLNHYYEHHSHSFEPAVYRLRKKSLLDNVSSDTTVSIREYPHRSIDKVNNGTAKGMITFHIPEFDGKALESVVHCIYNNQTILRAAEIPEIHSVITKLKIENLTFTCTPMGCGNGKPLLGATYGTKIPENEVNKSMPKLLRICSKPSVRSRSTSPVPETDSGTENITPSCNIVTITTPSKNVPKSINDKEDQNGTRKRKATDLEPQPLTTKTRRMSALEDIKKGYLIKEVALRNNISKEKVRRWRYEERRLNKINTTTTVAKISKAPIKMKITRRLLSSE